MKYKQLTFKISLLLLLISTVTFSQNALSLKECLDYANKNNQNIKISGYDLNVAQKKVNEKKGALLPQVNISGSLDDNLKLNTQLLPAEIFGGAAGTYQAVSFGTKYSLSAGIQLNQSIIDPTLWVGIETTKANELLSEQNLQRSREQINYTASLLYYQSLIIQKQIEIMSATLKVSEESLKSVELQFKNGMVKQTDVDKIRVSYNNSATQFEQIKLSYKQALNNLKFQMGMAQENEIVLPKELPDFDNNKYSSLTDKSLNATNRIEYKIQESSLRLSELDKKRNIASTLPTLSFYGNYYYTAMNQEFKFTSQDQNWYQSSAIGLKLSIPVFSGLQRKSRIDQSTINIERAKENIKITEQSIKVDISNYEIQYQNALDNIKNEKENFELAERVYKNTQLERKEGMSTSYDLIQAESSLREAQNNYFSKLLTLYIARINFEQSKGTLEKFINNQI
jgi:outer membrane protein TolC